MIDQSGLLCYVSGHWAWFTTRPLAEQWGDDWDDAPYEHNAGEPYEPCWHNDPQYISTQRGETPPGAICRCDSCIRDWHSDGTPRYRVFKVAYDGPFDQPCTGHWNSSYSVKAINAGAVAWLRSEDSGQITCIPAGVSLREFCVLIRRGGGHIWLPAE